MHFLKGQQTNAQKIGCMMAIHSVLTVILMVVKSLHSFQTSHEDFHYKVTISNKTNEDLQIDIECIKKKGISTSDLTLKDMLGITSLRLGVQTCTTEEMEKIIISGDARLRSLILFCYSPASLLAMVIINCILYCVLLFVVCTTRCTAVCHGFLKYSV